MNHDKCNGVAPIDLVYSFFHYNSYITINLKKKKRKKCLSLSADNHMTGITTAVSGSWDSSYQGP